MLTYRPRAGPPTMRGLVLIVLSTLAVLLGACTWRVCVRGEAAPLPQEPQKQEASP